MARKVTNPYLQFCFGTWASITMIIIRFFSVISDDEEEAETLDDYITNIADEEEEDDYEEPPEVLNVEEAVDELRRIHKSYLNRVLISLRDNFQERNEDPLLETNFFPLLRLEDLISLHKDLDTELEILEICHDEIGRVFERFRDRFLVYCQVSEKSHQLLQFLVNQLETSAEIR